MRARTAAGLSARQLAGALVAAGRDISPATISRIDNVQAAAPPDRALIELWLDIVEADAQVRDRVLALAEAAYAESTRWSDLLGEQGSLQSAVRERELDSKQIANYQPTFIPGLLQTPGYMRALMPLLDLAELDADATIAGRIERQQVLYDPERSFQFVIAEHVLANEIGGASVTAGQRDRLRQIRELDTVDVRILPTGTVAGAAWHGFVLHTRMDGAQYVTTELIHGTEQIHDAAGVAAYRKLWDRLWVAASDGG